MVVCETRGQMEKALSVRVWVEDWGDNRGGRKHEAFDKPPLILSLRGERNNARKRRETAMNR